MKSLRLGILALTLSCVFAVAARADVAPPGPATCTPTQVAGDSCKAADATGGTTAGRCIEPLVDCVPSTDAGIEMCYSCEQGTLGGCSNIGLAAGPVGLALLPLLALGFSRRRASRRIQPS